MLILDFFALKSKYTSCLTFYSITKIKTNLSNLYLQRKALKSKISVLQGCQESEEMLSKCSKGSLKLKN